MQENNEDFYLPEEQVSFKEEHIPLINWDFEHKGHERVCKTATLYEKTITGEIHYVLLICTDCKTLIIIDKFEAHNKLGENGEK